jgi:hypothetical protein
MVIGYFNNVPNKLLSNIPISYNEVKNTLVRKLIIGVIRARVFKR